MLTTLLPRGHLRTCAFIRSGYPPPRGEFASPHLSRQRNCRFSRSDNDRLARWRHRLTLQPDRRGRPRKLSDPQTDLLVHFFGQRLSRPTPRPHSLRAASPSAVPPVLPRRTRPPVPAPMHLPRRAKQDPLPPAPDVAPPRRPPSVRSAASRRSAPPAQGTRTRSLRPPPRTHDELPPRISYVVHG